MTARLCAAGIAALVGIASVFAPVATSSAGSASLKARPAPAAGALRAPAAARHARVPLHAASRAALQHHGGAHKLHRPAGFGVTGGWGYGGAYYDPSNYVLLHDQPPAPPAAAAAPYPASESLSLTVRVIPPVYEHRLGCQSQTQEVPSGSGARAITIMRC